MSITPLQLCLLFSSAVFCVGLIGALSRSNTILVLLGVELMRTSAQLQMKWLNALKERTVRFLAQLPPEP